MRAKDEMIKREEQLKQQPAKRRRSNSNRGQGVTLKTLIDENLITTGENLLSLEYCGKVEMAGICLDGRIDWKGTDIGNMQIGVA